MNWTKTLLPLLFSACVFGGQSLVGTSGNTVSIIDPTLLNTQDWTVEFEMHGAVYPGSEQTLIGGNGTGFQVNIEPGGTIRLMDVRDTISGGALCNLTPTANFFVRMVRNSASSTVTCEGWNYDSTSYQSSSLTISAVNSWAFSGGYVNTGTASADIGFFRILKGTVAAGGRIPTTFTSLSNPNLWTELKFDGSLSDSSSNAHNASVAAGSASYTATPNQQAFALFKPLGTPSWSNVIALQAGKSNQLDGSTYSYSLSDSSATVSFFWQQLSGPTTVIWSSHTSGQPNVSGLVFGDYLLQLTATDSASSGVYSLHVGAVAQDSNHVVVTSNDTFTHGVFGPQIAFGYNPWPYQDDSNIQTARVVSSQMGAPNSGAAISADWNVALAGTAAISGTTATVAAGGLQAAFCGGLGNTTPAGGFYFVDWYQDPNNAGRIGREYIGVAACPSDTTLTLSNNITYNGVACTVGSPCQYSRSTHVNSVVSGIGSYGYYDSANQFYGLWLRTGLNEFRDDARALDDITMTAPGIDQGVLYLVLPRINPTRQYATRMVMDDKAGDTAYQLTMRSVANRYQPGFVSGFSFAQGIPYGVYTIGDPRETGAEYMDIAAECASETDATWLTNCKSWLESGYTNVWSPEVKTDGHWVAGFGASGSLLGPVATFTQGSKIVTTAGTFPTNICGTLTTATGTVSVTNGSPAIVGSGTTWSGMSGFVLIFGNFGGVYGKEQFAISSAPDNTHITLDRNVHLDTASGLTYQILSSGSSPGAPGYLAVVVHVTDASGNSLDQANDPNWYACTRNSATQVTLDQNFQAASTIGKFVGANEYSLDNGLQPFMAGFIAAGLSMAATAGTTHATQLQSLAAGLYPYVSTKAYLPDTQGVAYAEGFASCNPLFSDGYSCGGAAQATWMYGVELIHAMSDAYLANPTPTIKTFLDKLYGTQWGNPAYATSPYSNGSFVQDCGAGYFTAGINLKFPAQCFSLGSTASWPAARLGGVLPAQSRTVGISFRLADAPTAAKVSITVYAPNGNTTTTVCATSPCAVTVDDRQGTALYTMQYQTAGNVPLATTPAPMQLK